MKIRAWNWAARALAPVVLIGLPLAGCDRGNTVDNGPLSTMTDSEALAARQACSFVAGDKAGKTLAKGSPLGDDIPIDHIVVLMFENRSFDHLFQKLPEFGQPDAEVAPSTYTNVGVDGNPVSPHHLDEYCFSDTNHEWDGSHEEYNDGKNDGFALANARSSDPTGSRATGYYTDQDLPVFYTLARDYALSDRFFCSLLGPTFPNRAYFYAGTSFGNTGNELITEPVDNLLESLERAQVDWRVYYNDIPGMGVFITSAANYISTRLSAYSRFTMDAAAGKLPSVAFVDPPLGPNMGAQRSDGHPPGNIQLMDAFLREVVETITTSPNWKSTALFIFFDEHGGLYDHVPPPTACAPDEHPPNAPEKFDNFTRLGFRVPLVVVSPYAKRHFVSHVPLDHTSVTRFIEARFGLPAMTKRDANATLPYDLFDFAKRNTKPVTLPPAVLDATKSAACIAQFGE